MIGLTSTNYLFSVRKCSCIVLGNISVDNVHYNIGKQPENIVSEVRDLSVIVDPALKFNSHFSYIVARAKTTCIPNSHKCFLSHNPKVKFCAFKIYTSDLYLNMPPVFGLHISTVQYIKIETVQKSSQRG